MIDNPTSDDVALTKAAARNIIENMLETQKAVMAESSATSRWLTASLLAVNAGAALSIFNVAERLGHSSVDIVPFMIGIFAALLTGVLGQKANTKALAMIGQVIGYAIVTAETGSYSPAAADAINNLERSVRRFARWPVAAGWASALLFGLGSIATAIDHRVPIPTPTAPPITTVQAQPPLSRCHPLTQESRRGANREFRCQ